MEWINVKDEQPPKDKDFLAYVLVGLDYTFIGRKDDRKRDIITCISSIFYNKFIENCHCSGYEHDREDIEVTHCMPLHEPPK